MDSSELSVRLQRRASKQGWAPTPWRNLPARPAPLGKEKQAILVGVIYKPEALASPPAGHGGSSPNTSFCLCHLPYLDTAVDLVSLPSSAPQHPTLTCSEKICCKQIRKGRGKTWLLLTYGHREDLGECKICVGLSGKGSLPGTSRESQGSHGHTAARTGSQRF